MSDLVRDYLRERYPRASEEFIEARLSRLSTLAEQAGKTCRACGKHKPFSEFGMDSSSNDGRMARCRACRK